MERWLRWCSCTGRSARPLNFFAVAVVIPITFAHGIIIIMIIIARITITITICFMRPHHCAITICFHMRTSIPNSATRGARQPNEQCHVDLHPPLRRQQQMLAAKLAPQKLHQRPPQKWQFGTSKLREVIVAHQETKHEKIELVKATEGDCIAHRRMKRGGEAGRSAKLPNDSIAQHLDDKQLVITEYVAARCTRSKCQQEEVGVRADEQK